MTASEAHHTAELRAGFGSFRFMPKALAYGHNNFNPKLILWSDHIECRAVFFTQKFGYEDVRMIDVLTWRKTHNLIITRESSVFRFTGNFIYDWERVHFLKILRDKGCSLSKKATELIRQYDDEQGDQSRPAPLN